MVLRDLLLLLIDPKVIVVDVFILFPHGLFGVIVNLNVHNRVINAITKFFLVVWQSMWKGWYLRFWAILLLINCLVSGLMPFSSCRK